MRDFFAELNLGFAKSLISLTVICEIFWINLGSVTIFVWSDLSIEQEDFSADHLHVAAFEAHLAQAGAFCLRASQHYSSVPGFSIAYSWRTRLLRIDTIVVVL